MRFQDVIFEYASIISYLLICWKGLLIGTLWMIYILKSRNYECSITLSEFIHDKLAPLDCRTKVRADGEVNVEHHDEVRSGEQAGDISPSIELSVKRVDDKVHINVG